MKYVLDANIAVAALNGVGPVRERLSEVTLADVGIPLVAVAELLFGAYKSIRREENLRRIATLRRTLTVLPLTDGIVDRYGALRATLESSGRRKSDFDLLIACTALDLDATLVTHDRDLLDGSIAGLRTEDWLQS